MDTKILIKNCCLFNLLQRGIKNQIVNVVRTYGRYFKEFWRFDYCLWLYVYLELVRGYRNNMYVQYLKFRWCSVFICNIELDLLDYNRLFIQIPHRMQYQLDDPSKRLRFFPIKHYHILLYLTLNIENVVINRFLKWEL